MGTATIRYPSGNERTFSGVQRAVEKRDNHAVVIKFPDGREEHHRATLVDAIY
jgi:hypothetical protein